MNSLVKREHSEMLTALQAAASRLKGPSLPIVKFDGRSGEWTVGADKQPLTERRFAADVAGVELGYLLFNNGEIVDSVMALAASGKTIAEEDLPPVDTANSHDAWTPAGKLQLRSVSNGAEYKFSTTSGGGMEALGELLNQLVFHGGTAVPIVELGSSSYVNKKTSAKIFKPVFAVVGWVNPARLMSSARNDCADDIENIRPEDIEDPTVEFDHEVIW